MKNFVLFILGIILGAIIMYFYCCKDTVEDMAPTPPKGLISASEAQILADAYTPRYDTISSQIVTRIGGDNRSSWYALEDIQNFINHAENQAGELKYTMNGIRLYLGAHPADAQGAGYTTLFMVPTGYENTSEGSMFNFTFQPQNHDIPGADGLDKGTEGMPPGINYPQ